MHQFKYKGVKDIGNLLGNIAGGQLMKNEIFNTVDLIVPVPLHKKRLRQSRYNQSTCFAEGFVQKLNAIVEHNNLVRIMATETQIHKSRFARFKNMQEVFELTDTERLMNKHILLVDDIITTGSTLEA